MNTTAAYTPLECLLLFQSLDALGTEDEDFVYISELLKKSPLIRNGASYDPQRLEANALRELYINLLRDDSRLEDQDEFEGNNQTPSMKRKSSSPTLSSSYQISRTYEHRLPLVVDRLYAKYRDYMIRAIKEDERKYAAIQGQIEQIEKGNCDVGILGRDGDLETGKINVLSAKKIGVHSEPSKPEIILHEESKRLEHRTMNNLPHKSSAVNESRQKELETGSSKNDKEVYASLSARDDAARASQQSLPCIENGSSQSLKISPLHTNPKPPSEQDFAPKHGSSSKSPDYRQGNQLLEQLLPKKHAGSPKSSLSSTPGLFPKISSRTKPNLIATSLSSQSPSQKNFSSSSVMRDTEMPLDALADAAGQQHGAPSKPISQSELQRNSKQKLKPKKLTANGSTQRDQAHDSGSIPNRPKQINDSPSHSPIQTENKQYSSPYNTSHGLRFSILSHLITPGPNIKSSKSCSSLLDRSTSHRLRKSTTGSGTNWTPEPFGSTPRPLAVLAPPQIEPLSPVEKSAKDKIQKQKKAGSTDDLLQNLDNHQSSSPNSLAETDSQKSILAIPRLEQPILKSDVANLPFKEEVDPPQSPEEVDDSISSLQDLSIQEKFAPPSNCEVRQNKEKSENKPQPPSKILWTRAFPRISAQALQDISTDKNASMFANPIKDKDAPGYRTIILRPQDLKSIRSAITAGHRAATAAAPEDLDPNATSAWLPISEDLIPPKGIINYAQLEKELMRMFANAIMFNPDPKRGLGPAWQDAVQRSKEEALGYAFDEDSVVKGTKDMFAAVEKKVSDLRSVERRSMEAREAKSLKNQVENQQDDLETIEESHAGECGIVAKKRRKA